MSVKNNSFVGSNSVLTSLEQNAPLYDVFDSALYEASAGDSNLTSVLVNLYATQNQGAETSTFDNGEVAQPALQNNDLEEGTMNTNTALGCGCCGCDGNGQGLRADLFDEGTSINADDIISVSFEENGTLNPNNDIGGTGTNNLAFYTTDQIANQLTNGYWGGSARAFDVGGSKTITVNITALDSTGMSTARAALETWEDLIDVDFVETTGSADISFDDSDTGAYNSSSLDWWSGGSGTTSDPLTINTSSINVDTGWTRYGTYYLQTYIHEIGHALGLGHGGNYNGNATFGNNASYANDSWQSSIMSYFDQNENPNISASKVRLLTPAMADVAAIQDLYGADTQTRSGNTTYGNGASESYLSFNTNLAATIYDAGGVDTINLTHNNSNQGVDLQDGTFSNINGKTGNVAIAEGTIIENVTTGSGHDTIYGNSVNNLITTNNGNDAIYGSEGNDTINGGLGTDTLYYDGALSTFTFAFTSAIDFVATSIASAFTSVDHVLNMEWLQFSDVLKSTTDLFAEIGSGGGGGGGGITNDYTPTVSVSDTSINAADTALASTFLSASDADGNAIVYDVWDGGTASASAHFDLDGTRLTANQSNLLTQAEFDRLELIGGSAVGTENMWLRASDGENTSAWSLFTVTSTASSGSGGGGGGGGGSTNDYTPIVSVDDVSLSAAETVLASSIVGASDADGNAITYNIWDSGTGSSSAYFDLDGTRLGAGSSVSLTQAEFDRLELIGGSAAGTESMWLQASDGTHTSAWSLFTVTSTAGGGGGGGGGGGSTNDYTPVVSVSNTSVAASANVLASTFLSASDADGNAMTYDVWDGGLASSTAYFDLDGTRLATNQSNVLTQAEFDRLELIGGSAAGSESMWLQASDGTHTSAWSLFTVTSTAGGGGGGGGGGGSTNDYTPVVSVSNTSVAASANVLASTFLSASDADGNAMTYDVWDGGLASSTAYFDLDGTRLATNQSNVLTQAEFDRLELIGGSAAGSESMWLRASDGTHTSAWSLFTVTSTAGGGGGGGGSTNDYTPVVSVSNANLNSAENILASSIIGASDADGNAITYFVWDSGSASTSAYFDLDGTRLVAGQSIALTQAEFDRLELIGGSAVGSESMWLQASDGTNKSAWALFKVTSTSSQESIDIDDVLDFGAIDDDVLSALDGVETIDGAVSGDGAHGDVLGSGVEIALNDGTITDIII